MVETRRRLGLAALGKPMAGPTAAGELPPLCALKGTGLCCAARCRTPPLTSSIQRGGWKHVAAVLLCCYAWNVTFVLSHRPWWQWRFHCACSPLLSHERSHCMDLPKHTHTHAHTANQSPQPVPHSSTPTALAPTALPQGCLAPALRPPPAPPSAPPGRWHPARAPRGCRHAGAVMCEGARARSRLHARAHATVGHMNTVWPRCRPCPSRTHPPPSQSPVQPNPPHPTPSLPTPDHAERHRHGRPFGGWPAVHGP